MENMPSVFQQLDQPVEGLVYEQAFHQLEEIVAALEAGEFPLDASIRLFERGQLLARYCAGLLDRAELKVQQLSGETIIDIAPEE